MANAPAASTGNSAGNGALPVRVQELGTRPVGGRPDPAERLPHQELPGRRKTLPCPRSLMLVLPIEFWRRQQTVSSPQSPCPAAFVLVRRRSGTAASQRCWLDHDPHGGEERNATIAGTPGIGRCRRRLALAKALLGRSNCIAEIAHLQNPALPIRVHGIAKANPAPTADLCCVRALRTGGNRCSNWISFPASATRRFQPPFPQCVSEPRQMPSQAIEDSRARNSRVRDPPQWRRATHPSLRESHH